MTAGMGNKAQGTGSMSGICQRGRLQSGLRMWRQAVPLSTAKQQLLDSMTCVYSGKLCSQGTDAQLDKHVKRAPQARMSTQDTHTHTQKMTLQDLSLSQRAGPDHRHEGSFWSKERAY